MTPSVVPATTGDPATGPRSLAAKSSRRLLGLHLVVIGAAALAWMAPLVGFKTGWWHSPSELNDLFRTHGVASAWAMGHWEARWLPALDFGYGYPVLFFEAPLFYWIGALLSAFFGDLVLALRVQLFVWLAVGALGSYALADGWWTRHASMAGRRGWAGLVAALAWMASPLGMVLLMVRGDGPAFAAAQIVPWVATLAMGLTMRPSELSLRDGVEALLLAAAGAVLCLLDASMVPTALVVVAGASLLGKAPDVPWSRFAGRVGLVAAAVAGGLVLTAWWWVPALVERANVHGPEPASAPAMRSPWADLLAWHSIPAPLTDQSFGELAPPRPEPMIGVVGPVAAASLLMALVRRRAGVGRALIPSAVLVAAGLILPAVRGSGAPVAVDMARVLWALAAVMTMPAGAVAWASEARGVRQGWVAGGGLLLVLVSLQLVGRTVPTPRTLWGGYFWDARLVARETTTGFDDYAPRWRPRRDAITSPLQLARQANDWMAPAGVHADQQGPESSRFELRVINTTPDPISLTVALNYYPGWTALLESAGRELPIGPTPEGYLRVDNIPPGQHNLRLVFGSTPLRSALWAVSLAGWVGWIGTMAGLVWLAREARTRQPIVARGDPMRSGTLPRPLMESAVVSLPRSRSFRRRLGVLVLLWILLMGALGQRWSFLYDSWLADAGIALSRVGDVLIAPISVLLPRTSHTTPPPGLSLLAAGLWLGVVEAWIWAAGRLVASWHRRGARAAGPADSEPVDPSRRALLARAVVAAPLAVGGSVAAYSVLVEPERLTVAEYEVPIDDLPPALDGLRLVQLSDLHLGPYITVDTIRRALHRARELQPDVVLLTGDYVHRTHGTGFGLVARLIADELSARLAIVATLGNHDHYEGAHLARHAFAPTGIPLVDNSRLFLSQRGLSSVPSPDAICLVGVGDLWTDRILLEPALEGVPASMPRLLLSHNPDFAEFYRLDANRPKPAPAGDPYWVWHNVHHNGQAPPRPPRIDLMLAGHTHGGQVRVPGLGTPVVPSTFGQKYAGGLVVSPHWRTIVSRGVGMAILPVRLGVPPEIGLIVLRRAAGSSPP